MAWVDDIRGEVLALDTAPLIYFLEANLRYESVVNLLFEAVAGGQLRLVTSDVPAVHRRVRPAICSMTSLESTSMAKQMNTAIGVPAPWRAKLLRGGWIVFGAIELLCVVIGTQNLLLAHRLALRLSSGPRIGEEMPTTAVYLIQDPVVMVLAVATIPCVALAAYRLARGQDGGRALALAFFGSGALSVAGYLLFRSGWLGDCISCGGPVETAQTEAAHAYLLTGLAACCCLVGLAWLRVREDYVD